MNQIKSVGIIQLKEKTEEIKQYQVANTKLSNDIQTSKKSMTFLNHKCQH